MFNTELKKLNKMKVKQLLSSKSLLVSMLFIGSVSIASAQTNVYDDVIASSANHTYLAQAIQQEGLVSALQDNNATLTVFAPTNQAFDDLAAALNTDINGLLALPNLDDVLLYHVLGTTVDAASVTNGAVVAPLSPTNSLKLTKTGGGSVYVNQAMVTQADLLADNGVVHVTDAIVLPVETVADIAIDNNFSTLVTAVATAELLPVVTDPFATLTVFAPTNQAFDDLAAALNTDINGLLALPNLADVLTYHVLDVEVASTGVTNGGIVQPVSATNTLKTTVTSGGDVFVNQAQVTLADLGADNGIIHVLDAVVLPVETVADIAIDNNFSTLVTAVATAELLPVVTDPFATLTVFAPTNQAFDDLATALNTDINGLLALPNLADVLTYHVLDVEVASTGVTNGGIVQPVSATNTLKTTVTSGGDVFVNQAQVTLADLGSDNGIVHVLDAVVLPVETVVDVAIDNNFTVLTQAVVTAELLPALTNPLTSYTVFAPSDQAFNDLATELNTDINGILALSNLQDILLYHVVDGSLLAADLTNGTLTTLNSEDVVVSIGMDVMINDATVEMSDITTDNGVVHAIDRVLDPSEASLDQLENVTISVYPNPANEAFNVEAENFQSVELTTLNGQVLMSANLENGAAKINTASVSPGLYLIVVKGQNGSITNRIQIL